MTAPSPPSALSTPTRYELRFGDLFNPGHGYAFPCNAQGHVDIDSLGVVARINYFYARAMVGRELHAPVTRIVGPS